jgi:predicted GH43/DUF377 family glycosyl hydrolase
MKKANTKSVPVRRHKLRMLPDSTRVIARPFFPGQPDRICSIVSNLVSLSPEQIARELRHTLRDFSGRHRNITRVFEKHFEAASRIPGVADVLPRELSADLRMLIGSYFTSEYSIEASALFNPSVVVDADQDDLEDGQTRLVMSFRAVGEGHISSIVFRSCIIDSDGDIELTPTSKLVEVADVVTRHVYDKATFLTKLDEMGIQKDVVGMVMDRLGDSFIYGELRAAVEGVEKSVVMTPSKKKVLQAVMWVAGSHYEITFSLDTAIDDRVIFPNSYAETNGIEDARFVRFTGDDGSVSFFATYTAYNGFTILPKLLKTEDFRHFKIMPIHGESAQNKGMSIFPRKIDGRYAMISRCDGINLYVNRSDNLNVWGEGTKIYGPHAGWNLVQVGNAGSPIETDRGWLVITHGVGSMRTYSLGAILLDLDEPERVVARLDEPFLIPNGEEREGYVPNVVYSCGSIVHHGRLIVPYGYSDYATTFASVELGALLDAMTRL